MDELRECEGFDWDAGNSDKNWTKHRVSDSECEEMFFNEPLVIRRDPRHSQPEVRYYALGQTDRDRCLFVVFTQRGKLVRAISARDMSQTNAESTKRMRPKKTIPKFKSEDEERSFWASRDSSSYIDWSQGEHV